MLVVLGELGDTPIPNAQDTQSVEEFMEVLETALQARQAVTVRANPLWNTEPAESGGLDPASSASQGGPETIPVAPRPKAWPFSAEYTEALEARLHASNLDRAEEIPENLLADLDDYYNRLRLWEENGGSDSASDPEPVLPHAL
eukprot:6260176-Amphidinium_carterae.2